MKTTVIHHSADFDGIFCREIARRFLPDAELIGWDFGQPKIPYPDDGMVYVLDLSPECLTHTPQRAASSLIWIDHHKSSIEKWPTQILGYRIDGVAACRLAWQWFSKDHTDVLVQFMGLAPKQDFINRSVIEPLAVRLAGEYDIWDKRDPRADVFQHGLRGQELTPKVWEMLLDSGASGRGMVDEVLLCGTFIRYAKDQENDSIIKAAGFTIQFEGLTFLACNHARYNSHLFTAGLTPEHDACLGFAWRGGQWAVSLYHAPGKEHHDLSQIAVKYGGGGHRGACGFRSKSLPFLNQPEK